MQVNDFISIEQNPTHVLGVDGGPRGHADVLPRHQLELKLLHEGRQGADGFQHRKLVAHALAGAPAEGDVPASGV